MPWVSREWEDSLAAGLRDAWLAADFTSQLSMLISKISPSLPRSQLLGNSM